MAIKKKHIVWDWNGTILDDNHVMLASVNEVCRYFSRPEVDIDTWRAALCRPLWRCYSKILDRDLSREDWSTVERVYHESYRSHLARCQLAEDAQEVLETAARNGLSQSLLSMGFHDDVTSQVRDFSIEHHFVRMDGVPESVAGGKKAEYLALHLDKMKISAEECIIIGDVVDDANAATDIGTDCVLVTTGMTGREELSGTGFPVAESLTEALGLVIGSSEATAIDSLARQS